MPQGRGPGDVLQEKKRKHNLQQEVAQYRSWYRSKRSSVRESAGIKKWKKVPWKGPKLVRSFDHMPQTEVKQLLPPGALIWRARLTSSWQARYKALEVRSCRDSAWGGEEGAVRECLKHVWRGYLDDMDLLEEACPSQTCSTTARPQVLGLPRARRGLFSWRIVMNISCAKTCIAKSGQLSTCTPLMFTVE